VDATLISAPSWTKNANGQRDPEMKQTKKATCNGMDAPTRTRRWPPGRIREGPDR
jgi:hypothetical protein